MADEEGRAVSILFRIVALVLSVAAAAVMGTASQLAIVDGEHGLSSYAVSYSQYNALTYFVAAGAISAICSAAALYLCAVRAAAAKLGSLPLVPLLDAAAQALLFSAAGAAFAARGVVGSADGPWGSSLGGGAGGGGSVCDAAGPFCGKVSVAAAVGAFAAMAVAVAALARDACRGGSSSSGGSCCDW